MRNILYITIVAFLLCACTKVELNVPHPAAPLPQEGGVPISIGLSNLTAKVETRSMIDNNLDTLKAKGFRCTCLKGTYDATSGSYCYSTVFSNVKMTYNSSDQRFYPPETYYYPVASDGAGHNTTMIFGASYSSDVVTTLSGNGGTTFTMYSDVVLDSPVSLSEKRPVQIIPNRTFTSTSNLTWAPAGATASFDAATGYVTVTSTGTGGYFAAHNWAQRVTGHIYLGVAEVMLPSGSKTRMVLGDNYTDNSVTITPSTSFRRYAVRWTANSSSDPIYFEVFRYDELSSGVHITAYVRNAFLVDLTATFGAGNEPTAETFLKDYPGAWYDYNTASSSVSITGIRGAQDYLAAEARGTVSSFVGSDPALQFGHGLARLKLTVRSANDLHTVRLKRIRYYRFTGGRFYHFYDASGSWPEIRDHMVETSGATETTIYNNPDGLILSTLGAEPLEYIPLVSTWGESADYNKLTFDWSVAGNGTVADYSKTISIGGSLTPYRAGGSYNYSLTLGGEVAPPDIDIDIDPDPARDSTGLIIDY